MYGHDAQMHIRCVQHLVQQRADRAERERPDFVDDKIAHARLSVYFSASFRHHLQETHRHHLTDAGSFSPVRLPRRTRFNWSRFNWSGESVHGRCLFNVDVLLLVL